MRDPVTVMPGPVDWFADVVAGITSAGFVEFVGTLCTSCAVTVVVVGAAVVATGAALASAVHDKPAAIATVDEVNASRLAVENRRMYSLPL